MKKPIILLAIALLCLVGWAGATYIIGGKVAENYSALLISYPHIGPVSLTGSDYRRGLFTSTAETIFRFEVPASTPQNGQEIEVESLEIVFAHSIKHGPLPGFSPALSEIETRIRGIKVNDQAEEDLFRKVPQLSDPLATTRISLDGTVHSRIRIAPFTIEDDDGQLSWNGFNFDGEFAPGFVSIKGHFAMPGMKINVPGGNLDWNGITGRFDLKEVLPKLYVGTQEVELGTIDMNLPPASDTGVKTIAMENATAVTVSRYEAQQIHYQQIMEFTGLRIDDEAYGPGALDIELKNLAAGPLSQFQSKVQELYLSSDLTDPQLLIVQLLPLYSQLFTELAAGNPELLINKLSFATPTGNVDGRARFKFIGQEDIATTDFATLLQNLEADADLTIDESLIKAVMSEKLIVQLKEARDNGTLSGYSDEYIAALVDEQLNSQIEAMLTQNFIVRDGAKLKANAVFNHGQLELNGRILPLFQ